MDSDLPFVIAVEQAANITPWSEIAFREALNKDHFYVMLDATESVIGYLIGMIVADEASLLHIAVANDRQKQGYGGQLLQFWLGIVDQNDDVASCWLEVRASNQLAQRLYERSGFRLHSRRKAYYRLPQSKVMASSGQIKEDALIYWRTDWKE
ncbi:MAG: ribosomal protein S18-alanine N-acetyltransferase [Arenicella sp.]